MCDVNAICPICRGDLDPHEWSCVTFDDLHHRTYRCPCGADVSVKIRQPAPSAAASVR